MKITWNGMEIECTPDEFEELYARGILTNKHNGEEALHDLYNLPKEEHNERNIPKLTIKDWDRPKQKDPFPTVAVYGCYMSDSWEFSNHNPRAGMASTTAQLADTQSTQQNEYNNSLKELRSEHELQQEEDRNGHDESRNA